MGHRPLQYEGCACVCSRLTCPPCHAASARPPPSMLSVSAGTSPYAVGSLHASHITKHSKSHSTVQVTAQATALIRAGCMHSAGRPAQGCRKCTCSPSCKKTPTSSTSSLPAAPAQVDRHLSVPVCVADAELCALAPHQDERGVYHQVCGQPQEPFEGSRARRPYQELPIDDQGPHSDGLCQVHLQARGGERQGWVPCLLAVSFKR